MTVSSQSKATDFLDYYNEETYQFDLVGVLDRHYEPTDATYYKVKDMIPWMIKNVPGKRGHSLQLWDGPIQYSWQNQLINYLW